MKKILILTVALAFIASLSITGTLAFLSPKKQADLSTKFIGSDSTPAVQALSDEPTPSPTPIPVVKIQQQTLMQAEGGVSLLIEEELPDLLPSPMFSGQSGVASRALPGNQLWDESGAIDNIIQVHNTGDLPVYLRTVFAVENSGGILDKNLIYLNYNSSDGVWEQITDSRSDVSIGGTKYRLFTYTYSSPLPAGASSPFSLKQAAMDAATTNEDVAPLGGDFKILSHSQAVSATGFSSAKEAAEAVFKNVSAKNHPWSGKEARVDETLAAFSE